MSLTDQRLRSKTRQREIMPKSRQWKPKPPVSQLDEAAAEHRRAQSRQAQRAFRQRKDDTISALQRQVSALESTIDRLSGCFLRFNDKLLEHLRSVDTVNGEGLAESIRDSMNEYKEIIGSEQLDIEKAGTGGSGFLGSSDAATNGSRHSPTPPPQSRLVNEALSSSKTGASTQQRRQHHQQQQQRFPMQTQRSLNDFSGPNFVGLTPTTTLAPHYSHEKGLQASSTSQDHHALASRLYNSTVVKAFLIVSSSDPSDPDFQRVFASYCSVYPPALAKQKVADMLQEKMRWSCFDKPLGRQRAWWSALQVAKFTCSQGWFDRANDMVVLRKRDGQVVVAAEKLLDDFLVDARCGVDEPEFRESTVISALATLTM